MELQSVIDVLRLKTSQRVLPHLVCWAIFIAYEISFVFFTNGRHAPLPEYVCYYGLNILLFYFNALVLLPAGARLPRRAIVLPLLFISELSGYLVIKYWLDRVLADASFTVRPLASYSETYLFPNIYRGIYFLGFSTFYYAVMRAVFLRKRVHQTETSRLVALREKTEVEKNLAEMNNALLQQQINPHLLFNTLAFIHDSYHKYSREASACVLLLTDIMRFSVAETGPNGKVALSEEVEQIVNLVELNKMRLNYKIQIDFRIEGDFGSFQIIPLVLMTFTENIFKHGYLKSDENVATLWITVSEHGVLKFISRNLKAHESAAKRIRSTGLSNAIKRLEFSYHGAYTLQIDDQEETYGLELEVKL